MLRKSEIRLLQILQRDMEGLTVSELSQKIGISLSRTSELMRALREKGFIDVERQGKKKLVFFADTKHAQLMKDLLGRFDFMDFSDILSNRAIYVLWLMDKERNVKEITRSLKASRIGVYRVIRKLVDRGVVRKKDTKYSLNPVFSILNTLAIETVHYFHRKKAEELTPAATIVWEGLREFIVKAPAVRVVEGFQLTGPSKLGDYGVPLFLTGARYYFYSEEGRGVDLYDVVVHTLLIDPRSTRYTTYLLIILTKYKVDEQLLMKKAENCGVENEVALLLEFLRTKGGVRADYFPTWREFSEKALDYGAEA